MQLATSKKLAAELNNARSELQRYKQLYAAGAIPQSQYETKRLSVDTAIQQLNEAQAGLVRTKATGDRKISEAKANLQRTIATGSKQISEAKVVLERIRSTGDRQVTSARGTLSKIAEVRPVDVKTAQAKVNQTMAVAKRVETELAQAYVRSPIAGQILDIFAKPGEVVKDNGIVDIGQTDRMQVVAEIDQGDIKKVRLGQSVLITGEAFAGELRGTVRDIGLAVSRQSTFADRPGENLDRRVVKVRIGIAPADSSKVAGLTNLQVQVAIQLFESLTVVRSFPRRRLYQAAGAREVRSINYMYIDQGRWRNPQTLKNQSTMVFAINPNNSAIVLPEVRAHLNQLKLMNRILYDRTGSAELFGNILEPLQQSGSDGI